MTVGEMSYSKSSRLTYVKNGGADSTGESVSAERVNVKCVL